MWPWSTIRRLEARVAGLQGDLARADANYFDKAAAVRTLHGQIAGLNTKIVQMNELHQATERHRQKSEQARMTLQEQDEQHVRDKKGLYRVLGARDAQSKALAAERDEAVLRARSVEKRITKMAIIRQTDALRIGALSDALRGAMVRNAKGQLVKWVDPDTLPGREAEFVWFEEMNGRLA